MGLRHLLLGLCLYMVALGDSFSTNAKILGIVENNRQKIPSAAKVGSAQELHEDTKMIGTTDSSKWMRGRKMQLGAEGALEKKKADVVQVKGAVEETGKSNISSKKSLSSETLHNKDSSAVTVMSIPTITKRNNAQGKMETAYPFQRVGSKKEVDAVTEMYNMLNRDYQIRARRRPPINNATPLH